MEGLEVSEVRLSEVENNKDLRIDSPFYTQAPFINPSLDYTTIGSILKTSQYGISIEMNEISIGTPIYRMNEIHNMLCDISVGKYAKVTDEELKKYCLNDRDVLFNRTNSYEFVGRTGLFKRQNDREFIFASYLVRFTTNEKSILPEYLTTYLNTKYGIKDIKRRSRQSINQTNVNPEEVKMIPIPLLSLDFQKKLKNIFDISHDIILKSQATYTSAERLLLEALGLAEFEPGQEQVNIKSFQESFLASGRLDAEFYEARYEKLEAICRRYAAYVKTISEMMTYNARGLQPEYSEAGTLDVINSRHILENGLDYDHFEKTELANWDKQEKAQVFMQDILIYTTGANIGRTQVYQRSAKALASNHVNILRIAGEDPAYVAFVLNSKIGRMQTERLSAGSAQQELYPKDIAQFYIPFVARPIQQAITAHLQQATDLRAESTRLLDLAKRAVETAIEAGEEAGMRVLEGGLSMSPTIQRRDPP
ncbi:MAG: restriction endonuclease subunit S [Bacteroidia bacterium]|nr:restriction endonuclease subunit S [Bacteroidia bacterium]